MSDTKYAYAVARIRALENGLFSSAQIEQLLSVKSYEGALRFLPECTGMRLCDRYVLYAD